MDEAVIVVIVLSVVGVVIAGAVCGISAVFMLRRLREELARLEQRLLRLERRPAHTEPTAPVPEAASLMPAVQEAQAAADVPQERSETLAVAEGVESPPVEEPPPVLPPPLPPSPESVAVADAGSPRPSRTPLSLEMMLGTKWMGWIGMVFFLISVGLGLKYAYDNDYIGPAGRLAIGVLAGVVGLGLGEYFRRRDLKILFQTFTGGGVAIFYLCVYFSFGVYHFTQSGTSLALGALVTAAALVLAVGHDAMAIAILALIGGFLSPVLFSSGGNHPYVLFSYIALLDLMALGAAYFRRWRVVDLLCFGGTVAMYWAWYDRFYDRSDALSQLTPALVFTSLFYLMFLLIPTMHSLARRQGDLLESLVLIVADAVWSFASYYVLLSHSYRHALGFVVLGQALLVFLLFQAWSLRVGDKNRTAQSLLVIALGLVTVAVPINLKLYGIPVAWAAEGAVFTYLGLRFSNRITRGGGLLALLLAAGMLFDRLPLHAHRFVPVFNVPFGSWAAVVAASAVAAHLLFAKREEDAPYNLALGIAAALLSFALACGVLSLEVYAFWHHAEVKHAAVYGGDSLVALWTLIPVTTLAALRWRRLEAWSPLALACFLVGMLVFLATLTHYDLPVSWPFLHTAFLARLAFVGALWWASRRAIRIPTAEADLVIGADRVLEAVGHGLLAVLLGFECVRWAESSDLLNHNIGVSLISAAWAIEAFALIWFGLASRDSVRRYFGFALFLLTAGKVLFVDTATLEKVYRIVSFMATGLLLLAAATFYNRYSAKLLGEERKENEP